MVSKLDDALRAARYWGAEFAANPGSSRSEYLQSIAMKLGKDRWFDLPPEQRNPLMAAFNEGIRAERKLHVNFVTHCEVVDAPASESEDRSKRSR